MTETIAYIKESLRDLYPSSEVSSLVRLIMERVCNIQPHHFLFCKDKELPESEKSRIHDIVERLKQMEPIQYILGTPISTAFSRSRPVRPDTTSGNRRTGRAGHPRQCRPKDQDIGYRNGKRLHSRHTPEASEKSKRDCDGHFGGSARDRRRNAKRNNTTVTFIQTDILDPEKAEMDIPFILDVIVSNPPYIKEEEKKTWSGTCWTTNHTWLFSSRTTTRCSIIGILPISERKN